MYVHRNKGLIYLAHMKTGSRAVRDVLTKRGFQMVYGHHGGPWHGRQPKLDNEPQSWWWGEDPSDYEFYCTVRNPFDIIRTFWYWQNIGQPFPQSVEELSGWLHRFMWERVPHFHQNRRLFRFPQEVPDVLIWHFEHQRNALIDFLEFNGLPPLEDHEYPPTPDSAYVTTGKPSPSGGPWGHYTHETRSWVEWMFEEELYRFGYVF